MTFSVALAREMVGGAFTVTWNDMFSVSPHFVVTESVMWAWPLFPVVGVTVTVREVLAPPITMPELATRPGFDELPLTESCAASGLTLKGIAREEVLRAMI
jgi:hypothetical protein